MPCSIDITDELRHHGKPQQGVTMRFPTAAGVALVGLLAFPTSVLAQSEKSHWGVVVAFTPEWFVAEGLFEDLFESQPNDLTGSEFQIGIARGRMLSGDWGVSLVRRKVKEGSTIGARNSAGTSAPIPKDVSSSAMSIRTTT